MTRLLVAGAVVLAAAGCGGSGQGGAMKVTGNCGTGDAPLAVEKVFPTAVLEKLVPDATYKAVGGLVVKDGRLPAAYDGDCTLEDSEGQNALQLFVVNKDDPRYAQAKATLAKGDTGDYTKVSDAVFVFEDSGPRAVAVLPDRMVSLHVAQPADGVGAKDVGEQARTIAERIESLS